MGISGSDSDVTRSDIQEVFSQGNGPCAPLTTDEVAARLDCPAETALGNLTELVELDSVETKQLDASTRIWWWRDESGPSGQHPESAAYSAFVSAVKDYAIFVLDPDGTVGSWNDGAERIKGYDEDDIVGEHFSTFYTPVDIDAGVPQENLETAAADGRVEDEGWRVRADGSRFWANVVISAVRDEGIDPAETGRIFELFQRLHSQEDHSGTGIGLALCRRIIERHGGELRVESEPGEGSTFSFTLPRAGDADE